MSATPTVYTTASLARKQLLWLRGTGPATVVCESGTLWITEDGSPEDVILEAGERHAVCGRVPVLIEALADSTAAVEAAGSLAWSAPVAAAARAERSVDQPARAGKALCEPGFARIDTGALMTSVFSGRGSAWRKLEAGAYR